MPMLCFHNITIVYIYVVKYHMGEEKEEDRNKDGWAVSTETWELSAQQHMKPMTELAGGELYLPYRPTD